MKETIRAFLAADGTLAGLLTGGFFASVEVSQQETAAAFDGNKEIQPCLNVRLETRQPIGPHPEAAEQFFTVSFYQFNGFDVIEPAVARTISLLHQQVLDSTMWQIDHVNTVPEAIDDALNCSMALSRFVAIYKQS
jgi:hypothetical protein